MVGVPTLFLVGGGSPEPFNQAGAAAADALGDCRVSVTEGQRHNAMDMVTDRFTGEVLGFLKAG